MIIMKTVNNTMKSLKRLSFLLLLAIPFISFGQWTEITPGSGSGGVTAIDCIDSTCFISGGQSDLVMKSIDGGQTWADAGIVASQGTTFFKMFSQDTVYVQRVSTLYRTYNGGTTWEEVPMTYSIMSFVNSNIGFASNGSGGMYKTTDKGNSWNYVNSSIAVSGLSYFTNEQIGFTRFSESGNHAIYKTSNGGQTWTKVYENATKYIIRFFMFNSEIGYACGGSSEGNLILKTTDGGNSWVELTHPFQSTSGGMSAIDFINTNSGYVVGGGSRILKTIDGGVTWMDESYSFNLAFGDVKILDLQTVYIAAGTINFNSTLLKNSSAGLVASILENNKNIGNIYPNPTTDKIYVEIEKQNCNLRLFDINGKILLDSKLVIGQSTTIDVSTYQKGFYLYQIYDNAGVVSTGKLTKI